MNYKSYEDLLRDIRRNIGRITGDDFDLIVGIPRSGMIPAYMLSLYLNLNCVDLLSFIANSEIRRGNTRKISHDVRFPWDAKSVLLVDDSTMTGSSMRSALGSLPSGFGGRVTSLAVYSATRSRQDVDFFFEFVPLPRVFEWNILHHQVVSQACIDIDVLCAAPIRDEDDDGYVRAIAKARPSIVPTPWIHSLVTRRPERCREETEEWLERHGVTYGNLIMADMPGRTGRPDKGAYVRHMADYYGDPDTNLMLFIAARPDQARQIVRLTGKPAYCVADSLMRNPRIVESLRAQTAWTRKIVAIAQVLPLPVQEWLKPWYRKLRKDSDDTETASSL